MLTGCFVINNILFSIFVISFNSAVIIYIVEVNSSWAWYTFQIEFKLI